ncbi:U32 family peptidase [Anaerofilum sp. BX8]|uniref:U32 family peptidase n=2 Tax=Anaerofilum hominis TaxID=2763016 RepID=A0A923I9N8_9FIRM|nr:U32 family peptidase [Anaerofilum hominis]MBC5581669.1 U32 family peptidase [Anaerofilum hominis]
MLKAAVFAGANSVYLGLTGFNARRTAGNFTPEALAQAVAFCHARDVRVNVTLNTLCRDGELDALRGAVEAIAASGADAVIVQDLAAARLVRGCAPGLALHGSTQMSVMNLAGARQLAQMGFSRVILARELTAREVEEITAGCGIETEIFVHGALCMSVSGQCLMSAFYGGRSGNRGGCAGPCRLPYRLDGREGHFLSLKDLSLIDRLPEVREMGVRCAKIEGRLRTPEYVAAAVSAARAALEGRAYDRGLLEKAFSRAGFTSGFYDGAYLSGEMFGRRDEAQAADTRAALPRLRELYRRERPSVPVALRLTLEDEGAKLSAADRDGNRAVAYCETAPQPAQRPEAALREGYEKALEKTGGTPFFAEKTEIAGAAGRYLPAAAVNELRRQALAALLQKREAPRPWPCTEQPLPAAGREPAAPAAQRLFLRFSGSQQCGEAFAGLGDRLIFPLECAAQLPAAWREKTVLALPRALFDEKLVAGQLRQAAGLGFSAFEVQNIGGLPLVRENAPGAEILGGFGLNVTNSAAAHWWAGLGLSALTLSPELPLAEAGRLNAGAPTGLLAYGHLPLMLTRACPVRNSKTCAQCRGKSELIDRKGRRLTVSCTGPGANGARELLNPVPLWLGDRRHEVEVDFAVLYFTGESADRAAEITRLYREGLPFDGEFTRGLYYKTVE